MNPNKTSINLFLYELIAIIAEGHKESIEEIEEQIDNNNIAQYILGKYEDLAMINLEDYHTNKVTKSRIDTINEAYLCNYDYARGSNKSRKFGITKEDDGLLLLVAVGIMIIGEQF